MYGSNLLCGDFILKKELYKIQIFSKMIYHSRKEKKVERNQKINCTVASCKYNNTENAECILKAIHVSPMEGCETKKPDESMCASYENQTK